MSLHFCARFPSFPGILRVQWGRKLLILGCSSFRFAQRQGSDDSVQHCGLMRGFWFSLLFACPQAVVITSTVLARDGFAQLSYGALMKMSELCENAPQSEVQVANVFACK